MTARIPLLLLVCAALPAASAPASGQGPEGLTLEHAVAAALERSPGIALARQSLAAGAGELEVARGAFASRLTTSLVRSEATEPGLATDGSVAAQPTVVSGSYELALAKRLRSGVLLQPQMSVTRTDGQAISPLPTTSASVGLQMVVPLWKDRGGVLLRASERAAAEGYEADRLSLRQAVAASVLEAAGTYWEYVAAVGRSRVYSLSEERAQRMVEETRVLVAADERPAADLNQLMANVASKRMARIAAEQAVVEARRRLGLAMGLGAEEIRALPLPADGFPRGEAVGLDSLEERRLVEVALAGRPDLAATRRQAEAAEALLRAARNDLRPQLDLALSLGYRGLGTGDGLREWVQPLYRDVPGMNSAVQLEYRIPVSNDEARGREAQHTAAVQQQRIREATLRRQISSGVEVAVRALERSVLSAAEAEVAVELYRTTVENEQRKHRLDAATLFDVIHAEDALTGAMLGQVSAQLGYALAVASLRFETGTLLTWTDGRPVVRPGNLLRPPGDPAP